MVRLCLLPCVGLCVKLLHTALRTLLGYAFCRDLFLFSRTQVNDLGALELLPVRSFFAEALANLYVVSGEKAADERARDLGTDIPGYRGSGDGAEGAGMAEDGSAGLSGAAGAVAEGDLPELRSRRVRRFRS